MNTVVNRVMFIIHCYKFLVPTIIRHSYYLLYSSMLFMFNAISVSEKG